MNLEGLNPQQKEAAMHKDGPCVVVAAAGSGKTKVLTTRIGLLIESGVNPEHILACTFTRKSAIDMRRKLAELIGPELAKNVLVSTIHSWCWNGLKRYFNEKGQKVEILDEPARLVKRVLRERGWKEKESDFVSQISRAKNQLLSPKQVEDAMVAAVYADYEKLKEKLGYIDMDDMLVLSERLLRTNKRIREDWQSRHRYILVDEFQDTNNTQWSILKYVAQPLNNLFVVGDTRQSIYKFRSANPSIMIGFKREYPNAKLIALPINYRCDKPIIDISNRVIDHYKNPLNTPVIPFHKKGEAVSILKAHDQFDEAVRVARYIWDRGGNWSDYAVLYRVNHQSETFESVFTEQGIPYQIVGDTHFYEMPLIQDWLNVLRSSIHPSQFLKVLEHPLWSVGPDIRDALRTKELKTGKSMLDLTIEAGVAKRLTYLVKGIQKSPNVGIAFQKMKQVMWPNSSELAQIIEQFERVVTRNASLPVHTFLRKIDFVIEKSKQPKKDAVQLMTFHASKGLEFPTVFMVGMVQGVFPHEQSINEGNMDEEIRLCYVGLTRAQRKLVIIKTDAYSEKKSLPSVFLEYMKPKEKHTQ